MFKVNIRFEIQYGEMVWIKEVWSQLHNETLCHIISPEKTQQIKQKGGLPVMDPVAGLHLFIELLILRIAFYFAFLQQPRLIYTLKNILKKQHTL